MRLIGLLLMGACGGSLAHAQFFDFLADWSEAPPADSRPVTAEITATLKASSPWGEITTVESGSYWRNAKGQDRFDNAYGVSQMRDRRGPVLRMRVDRNLRLVDIEEKTAGGNPAGAANEWITLPFPAHKSGQRTVEGLAATVRTGEDNGVSYEVWTEDALGLILYARYRTDHTTFEQRVHNLRFTEPDPAAMGFAIPRGFRTHVTCWSPTEPLHEAPRPFQPGKDLCR